MEEYNTSRCWQLLLVDTRKLESSSCLSLDVQFVNTFRKTLEVFKHNTVQFLFIITDLQSIIINQYLFKGDSQCLSLIMPNAPLFLQPQLVHHREDCNDCKGQQLRQEVINIH